MEDLRRNIEHHYHKEGLFEEILKRLKHLGIAQDAVQRSDIAAVDEFHVRGAAVSEELAQLIDLSDKNVLDVGCGIGGPARMLADEFNCRVTGIDLSKEFIRTAQELTKLVKLDHKAEFVVGDATKLPFEENTFDVVWTQHVQMNIPDKPKLYAGIQKVLNPGGHFLYYDIFKNQDNPIQYPMPWATSSDHSFLFKSEEMHDILKDLGLKQQATTNQTEAGIAYFETLLAKLKAHGPPEMGLNLIMGQSTGPKLLNLLEHLKNGSLMLESGVYQKE